MYAYNVSEEVFRDREFIANHVDANLRSLVHALMSDNGSATWHLYMSRGFYREC
jgi:hypothetical protein